MPSKSFENADKLNRLLYNNNVSTFNTSISAPALSGSFFGDGSRLSGILASTGGTLNGSLVVQNNLTVQGNLTALGTSTFVNTTFQTTSALSITNVSAASGFPALYVGQNGPSDIASFYDIDQNIEVLHVGGTNSLYPNVGIKTSAPNKTLTVVGEISATQDITTSGKFRGDGSLLTGVSTDTSAFARLSGATFTGSVSAPALSGAFFGDGSSLTGVKSQGVVIDSTSITTGLTSYTLKFADANKVILCNNTSALTAGVPANIFNVGTEIVLIQRGGVVTLSAGPGVTIESNGNKLKTNGTSAGVGLVNIQTNVWFLGGSTAA